MTDQEKLELITKDLQEVIGEEGLKNLIKTNTPLTHYVGLEISGLLHLGTASLLAKVGDLQKAGVKTKVYLADWHTWINDKLSGNHEFIKKVGKEYFQPALEAAAKILGADPNKTEFILGSELYHNNDGYWQTVVDVSKNLTLSRVMKSISIMGRTEDRSQPFAWLVYPPMQVADIMEMDVNLAHSGMDQRKVHVIAREVAEQLKVQNLKDAKGNTVKPVCLHNRLILGLQAPKTWPIPEEADENTKNQIRTEMKMSKSIPGSAIFIHDSEKEIREKVKNAFCPPNHAEFNPLLDWSNHLLFPLLGEITIKREEKYGGSFTAKSYKELEERYMSGDLYPLDLKNNIADILVDLLQPAREAFDTPERQNIIKKIKEVKKKR